MEAGHGSPREPRRGAVRFVWQYNSALNSEETKMKQTGNPARRNMQLLVAVLLALPGLASANADLKAKIAARLG